MIVGDKERSCKIIDFAVPGDSRIEKKKDNIKKSHDFRRELQKTWNVKKKIIQLAVVSLGAILNSLGIH